MFEAASGQVMWFGALDPATIEGLVVPDYQREALPVTSVEEWVEAYFRGQVPAIDLGTSARKVRETKSGTISVATDVNIVDGLQRLTSARIVRDQGGKLLILALLYLGTTYEWEVARFGVLNASRRLVSGNILLRNNVGRNRALASLHDYSTQRGTYLSGKVQWSQKPGKGHLITASSLLRVAAGLHSHFGKGLNENNIPKLTWSLEDVAKGISVEAFVANVDTFFRIIAKTGKIEDLQSSRGVVSLKLGYMLSLADLFAAHSNFWVGDRLVLGEEVEEHLIKFKLDPIRADTISNRGRRTLGLIELFAREAVKTRTGRRVRLTTW